MPHFISNQVGQLTSIVEAACWVITECVTESLDTLHHARVALLIPGFRQAVIDGDKERISRLNLVLTSADYTPRDIYRIARRAKPGLTEAMWGDFRL